MIEQYFKFRLVFSEEFFRNDVGSSVARSCFHSRKQKMALFSRACTVKYKGSRDTL